MIISKDKSNRLKSLYEKHGEMEGDKYVLNQEKYLNEKIRYYSELNLNKKVRYLDISTGIGMLPLVFNYYGHTGECTDINTNPFLNEAIEILELNRTTHTIEPFKPFHKFDEKFDIIISTRITFNNHKKPNIWKDEEWKFLIDDLKKQLNDSGLIKLYMNSNDDFNYPEMKKYRDTTGAYVMEIYK